MHSPDINECESQPCLNGGECIDQVANFTCVCPAAFTGTLCETGDLNSAKKACLEIWLLIENVDNVESLSPNFLFGLQ